MRTSILAVPAILTLAGGAMAQTGTSAPHSRASNLPGGQIGSTVAPNLPTPPVTGSQPSDFLRAAQSALAAGRTGEAQQAMEMAQTRLLDRAVPLGQTNVPDTSPLVTQISQALRDLGAGNRSGSMQKLQAALAAATAQGM